MEHGAALRRVAVIHAVKKGFCTTMSASSVDNEDVSK